MTTQEMHIEVNQSLQKVAANKTRKFLNEEIDLVLNKMVHRFVQSKVKPRRDGSGGFEIDQLDVDAVRPLLKTVQLPAYISDPERYVAFLPGDYDYLIADSSFVHNLCGIATPAPTPKTLTILTLRQDRSGRTDPPFYASMSVQLGGHTTSIPGSLSYNNSYAGYGTKEEVRDMVPHVLHDFWAAGLDIHWEVWNNIRKPGHYILAGEDVTAVGALIVDGTTLTQLTNTTRTLGTHATAGTRVANRLTNSSMVPDLLNTAFYKSSSLTPISELQGDNIYLYTDGNFTVNKLEVVYIRKPRIISLLLGTDCDLAPTFHQHICDLAVEYITSRLGKVAEQQLAQGDNDRRVTL